MWSLQHIHLLYAKYGPPEYLYSLLLHVSFHLRYVAVAVACWILSPFVVRNGKASRLVSENSESMLEHEQARVCVLHNISGDNLPTAATTTTKTITSFRWHKMRPAGAKCSKLRHT